MTRHPQATGTCAELQWHGNVKVAVALSNLETGSLHMAGTQNAEVEPNNATGNSQAAEANSFVVHCAILLIFIQFVCISFLENQCIMAGFKTIGCLRTRIQTTRAPCLPASESCRCTESE